MTALILRATPLIDMIAGMMTSRSADHQTSGTGRRCVMGRSEPPPTQSTCTLDLSKSRAYDAALDILGAYKLTGNFHINLEIVLKSLGAFDKVTFEVEPKAKLPYHPFHPDCRHVVFRPSANLPLDRFGEIIRSIEARIGFDAAPPWWVENAA
jgi:hypothetical protein